jgi:hypothetical protein
VGADKAIRIANYLCPGNYAVSGSIEGCEAVERLGKDPAFKARMTVSGGNRESVWGGGEGQPQRAAWQSGTDVGSVSCVDVELLQDLNCECVRGADPLSRLEYSLKACAMLFVGVQVRLAVAGAFHTSYMAPAAEKLQDALNNTTIVTPRIPVISNVDAQPHSDPATIKAILAKQVSTAVVGKAWRRGVGPEGQAAVLSSSALLPHSC